MPDISSKSYILPIVTTYIFNIFAIVDSPSLYWTLLKATTTLFNSHFMATKKLLAFNLYVFYNVKKFTNDYIHIRCAAPMSMQMFQWVWVSFRFHVRNICICLGWSVINLYQEYANVSVSSLGNSPRPYLHMEHVSGVRFTPYKIQGGGEGEEKKS